MVADEQQQVVRVRVAFHKKVEFSLLFIHRGVDDAAVRLAVNQFRFAVMDEIFCSAAVNRHIPEVVAAVLRRPVHEIFAMFAVKNHVWRPDAAHVVRAEAHHFLLRPMHEVIGDPMRQISAAV